MKTVMQKRLEQQKVLELRTAAVAALTGEINAEAKQKQPDQTKETSIYDKEAFAKSYTNVLRQEGCKPKL